LSRERIIERERRWARPAAIVTLVALVLLVAAVLERSAIPSEDHTGAQLRAFDQHSGALLLYAVFSGLAFLLLTAPLLYLFRAAQARNPRVHGGLVAFCFIGPILIAAQGITLWLGLSQVASDYVERAPQEQVRTLREFRGQLANRPESIQKVTIYTDSDALEVEQADGRFYSTEYPPKAESGLVDAVEKRPVDSEEDSDGEVGDAFGDHLTDESTAVSVGTNLLFPGALGMIVAMVYIPLQAVRAGLLTRFFGTLGMALGVSLIILPQAQILIALWFGYLGFLFLGRVPGGRPPAWDAGEAIPWPRPGEEESAGSGPAPDEVEGEATEVEGAGETAKGGQPRSAKRKRKRRR
jgi:hypothetical protein